MVTIRGARHSAQAGHAQPKMKQNRRPELPAHRSHESPPCTPPSDANRTRRLGCYLFEGVITIIENAADFAVNAVSQQVDGQASITVNQFVALDKDLMIDLGGPQISEG